MKTNNRWTRYVGLLSMGCAALASAGEVSTSATAGSRGYGPGRASATAAYDGNGIGITHTRTRSGRLNLARGVSIGIDKDGVGLSTSYAVAPQRGPAVAGTFNLHIGADGAVSGSAGRTIAAGDRRRSVNASGSTGRRRFDGSSSTATVSGATGGNGRVFANSQSFDRRPHYVHSHDRRSHGRRVLLKRRSARRF